MHILLTRPLEDCYQIILKFQKLGHQVSHLPLLSIQPIKYEFKKKSNYKAIIFTSANAVKFLDCKDINKTINCFCVGNATEKKARSCGFTNTLAADGNVENLKELIFSNFNVSDGKLIYVSGETISNNLDQKLIKDGYNIERIINYRTQMNKKFDDNFVEKLKQKIPDIIYIYSQKSANSFMSFIKDYDIENLWMNTNLMCISEKTSSVLNNIKWKKIFIFNPGEEEFLLYKI